MTAAPASVAEAAHGTPVRRARRLGIDTGQEAVVYLHRDSQVVRSEGFESETRIWVQGQGNAILATLNVVTSPVIAPDEVGLSESAWTRLNAHAGEQLQFAHPMPLDSLGHVRAKIYGHRLDAAALASIVDDIAAGRYSDIDLAAFLTACAGGHLSRQEIVDLTRAMIAAGERIQWDHHTRIMDKHCVGGVPGNRTSLIVVPIVAAAGLVIPKTSSRAITSPAGTVDAMETLAPVELDLATLRRVVEREGACIAWGGAARLSPADDILIRVEGPLDLDSPAQLVASVLSKKSAAGATHVLIDLPVGPTAKVRSAAAAAQLCDHLHVVATAIGLVVRPVVTDGSHPIGRGVGPALEARDARAVLRGESSAPPDLRERALLLAGELLELAAAAPQGEGAALAGTILQDGRAWRKFQAICEAQGGLREPPQAPYTKPVVAQRSGHVTAIDNRRLARVAKLAGAPHDRAAGLELHVRAGDIVARGEPLFTVHAAATGELDYALAYAAQAGEIVRLDPDG